MLKAIIDALRGKQPVGGMVGQAQSALAGADYRNYVAEQKAQGLPPVPPEQFAKGER